MLVLILPDKLPQSQHISLRSNNTSNQITSKKISDRVDFFHNMAGKSDIFLV